jgi:ankyrin repeat protein
MRLLLILTACSSLLAESRLLDAVKRRDPKAVESLLKQQADANSTSPDGGSALAWAVHLGDRRMVEMLLASGAKVTAPNEYGETPLTLACLNGDAPVVEMLLKAGADAKSARWNGETALMIAAGAGSVDAVKMLIAAGAGVNAKETRKGQTALMWAAAEGHAEVVRTLLEKGADVKAASTTGFTPLLFATVKNDAPSVRALIAGGADPNAGKPILSAASHRSTAAAIVLAEAGANPNVADPSGNTPLHLAAQNGDEPLAKLLLAKKADIEARTANIPQRGFFRQPVGQTPLLLAARAGQLKMMKLLIDAGANPKTKAPDGGSFLMASVGSAKVEAVKFAYQYDDDVKVATTDGATLMHASVTGTSNGATLDAQLRVCEVIAFLAEKGAPLDEKNAAGRTPIDLADILPIDKAVDLLTELILKSGAKPKSPSKR